FTGQATWYNTGLGACGETNDDSHPIVAVSKDIFEQYNPSSGNPNENSLCGKKIEIDWQGKKQLVFAMDECPSCAPSSLDLSPAVFKSLDDPDKGLLKGIQWKFV
ncbi:plant expansin, partial [Testicularia cyperi]